jgi:hypothetical protein
MEEYFIRYRPKVKEYNRRSKYGSLVTVKAHYRTARPTDIKKVETRLKMETRMFILHPILKGIVLNKPDGSRVTVCRKCWSKGMFDLAEVRWLVPKWEFTLCPKDRKRYFKKCPNCKVIHRKPVRQVRCDLCGKMF